jgi:hydroxyethylthiazole kinase
VKQQVMNVKTVMNAMGIAGELAGLKSAGSGNFQLQFLDALYNLEKTDIEKRLKLSKVSSID